MRLRRARCLVCYWHNGAFVAHPFLRGKGLVLSVAIAEVLDAFTDWRTVDEAVECLPHEARESVAAVIPELVSRGLLLAEGSQEDLRDEALDARWGPWSPEASFFHFATQNHVYSEASGDDREALAAQGRPPIFTTYPEADRILLPRVPGRLDEPLGQVLYRRRTHRSFTSAPVPLAPFAALLSSTFGPADYIDAGAFGALIRRTSPSGGARQELEAYLGIRQVSGVTPGWYHYNSLEHSLELMAEGCTGEDLSAMCGNQQWVEDAAFIVVVTAEIERMLAKYRNPRAYRVCLLNAGHLGQTFALSAVALGLGPFQTGAFHDKALAERLNLDNVSRTPLYVLGAGLPDGEWASIPAGADMETFGLTTLQAKTTTPPARPA
ncbi:SagB/ThcOx family dehydrogenase [[Actinomadura] parvosata]|uniref:SagB/ThcOx family dehydrogenase n=1 Tax=[Actinomadura] parvosata TaxID=1955412 RepID=UPI001C8FA803